MCAHVMHFGSAFLNFTYTYFILFFFHKNLPKNDWSIRREL